MKQPDTHAIERTVVTEKTQISRDFLDTVLDGLGERPDLLPTVFRREVQLAAGLAQSPRTAAKAAPELMIAARTAALMFVHARHHNPTTFIALDGKVDVELQGDVDASFVSAPAWIEAMWCTLACGDLFSQQWLATVPPAQLKPVGVQHGRYAFALGEFLRSLVTRDGRHGEWLAQAIEAAGDEGDSALQATRDWADGIDLPALRAAFHLLREDTPGFDEALFELHQQHKGYWSSGENKLAVDGLLSLRGCALLRLAGQMKVKASFASSYMPPAVWKAPAVPHAVRCPYCAAPLADGARACGPCGRAIQDAPLELSVAAADAQRTPCKTCAYPRPKLAVLCAQCRSPCCS